MTLSCMDAWLHNTPDRIPETLRGRTRRNRHKYSRIFVAYADCGTGGRIDSVLLEEGVERLPGAHCYEFFAGERKFQRLAEAAPGTFYLTNFLVKNFNRFVVEPLKFDICRELRDTLFGNYRRVVYLSQTVDDSLVSRARDCAGQLGLPFKHAHCGYGTMEVTLRKQLSQVRTF